MGCPNENTLVAMVEHALAPARFAELEHHIDSCEHCRMALAAVATARTLAVGTPGGDAAAVDAPDVVNDRYEVSSVLGRGGMGTVYLARDRTLGRDVALKVHRAGSGNDRLQREALAMARLQHPNVVTVFEIGSFEDRLYVAMECVRGGTLRDWAAAPHTWRERIAMLLEVGAGLAAAHDAGLVHRDFKPENVLVGADGRPRVSDFGLARVGPAPSGEAPVDGEALTQTGAVVGTPAYMAPEQLDGGAVDARSDQFAFALAAWEVLFAARPFAGCTLGELRAAIARQALPPTTRDVPDRVRRVLARGLAVDPAARYPELRALLAELRAAARPRTARWLVAGALVAAAAIAGTALGVPAVRAHRHALACTAAGDAVRGLVSPETRAAIARAFVASGAPFAAGVASRTTDVLARAADALAARTSAVCRGTGEAAPVAAARGACLADHRAELASLVGVLEHADAGAVSRATDAAWSVFDPAPCSEPVIVTAAAPPSAADATALGELHAIVDAGRYQDAIARGEPLRARAHARGDREVELEATIAIAEARDETDGPEVVGPLWRDVDALAEALGRDRDAALALGELANLEGTVQHDHAAAHRDLALARAKLERLGGGTPVMRGTIDKTCADVLMDEDRLGEAEKLDRRALAAFEQAYGEDHPKVGAVLGTLSEILRGEGKQDEAMAMSRRTLDVLSRALGDDHPTVAGARLNLASSLIDARQYGEARALLQRADAVFVRVFGENHPARAAVYGNLGELEQLQQHWDAALAAYRTAEHILEQLAGPTSVDASGARRDVARTLAMAGRLDEAIAEETRAIAILDQDGADGAPRLVGALTELAQMQLGKGPASAALPAAARAVQLAEARPADANPNELADARFVLARALGRTARGRALATAARAGYTDADHRGDVDAWLAGREPETRL